MRKANAKDKKQSGQRIKAVRHSMRLSQEQMSETLNISVSAYKKIECGENNISVDVLRTMKREMGVSADYLLFGEQETEENTWLQILNCSEEVKMKMLLRLAVHFGNSKNPKYMKGENGNMIPAGGKEFIKGLCWDGVFPNVNKDAILDSLTEAEGDDAYDKKGRGQNG